MLMTRWKTFPLGKMDFFVDAGFGEINYSTEIQTPGWVTTWWPIKTVNDYTLGYGLGAGFHYPSNGLGLFVRVLYMWSGNSTYVNRSSLLFDVNENLTYETSQTKTSQLSFQLGFSFSELIERRRHRTSIR